MIACVRGCTVRRRHQTDCEDPTECRGCELRPSEGGMLCRPCHLRLELMLHDAPVVDSWLTVNMGALGSNAAKEDWERPKSGQAGSPAPLSAAVFDVRQQLRDQLASWVDEFCTEQTDLTGPKRHNVTADAGYLERFLKRVEAMSWVADLWDEIAETMSDAHALAPWRPAMRRRPGIPCPNKDCGATMLVIFGGEDVTTCLACNEIITPAQYGIWLLQLRYDADQRALSA